MMEDMLAQHRSKLETDRQALRSINTAKRVSLSILLLQMVFQCPIERLKLVNVLF